MFVRIFSEEVGFITNTNKDSVEEIVDLLEQTAGVRHAEIYETADEDDVVPVCFVKHDGEKYFVEYA